MFCGKHRNHDVPVVHADEHSLILSYRGVPKGHRESPFNPEVFVQALDYKTLKFSPCQRSTTQPEVRLKQKDDAVSLTIRFQSAVFEAIAREFRCYALIDDDRDDGIDITIDPDELLNKRAYFERQMGSEGHYEVWDKLLATGCTRHELWVKLQEKYLFRYHTFLRVWSDWGGYGIWEISFPGSLGTSACGGYDRFNLPKKLISRFDRWTGHKQRMTPGVPFEKQGFRADWYRQEGEALACELAQRVDPRTYVEYHPFQQVKAKPYPRR